MREVEVWDVNMQAVTMHYTVWTNHPHHVDMHFKHLRDRLEDSKGRAWIVWAYSASILFTLDKLHARYYADLYSQS